jgi:KRAB domain-containing zinc finger protein
MQSKIILNVLTQCVIFRHKLAHLRKKGITPECDFQCPICGKFFSTNNYLHKHVARIHQGFSEDIKCEMCDMVFPHKYAMKRHMNRKHEADPRFRCDICNKFCEDSRWEINFENKETSFLTIKFFRSLREHMNMHGEPQYFCKFCGKGLRSMKSLKNHERIHTGENPYKYVLLRVDRYQT